MRWLSPPSGIGALYICYALYGGGGGDDPGPPPDEPLVEHQTEQATEDIPEHPHPVWQNPTVIVAAAGVAATVITVIVGPIVSARVRVWTHKKLGVVGKAMPWREDGTWRK